MEEDKVQQLAGALLALGELVAQSREDDAKRHAELMAALTAPKNVNLERDAEGNLIGGTTTVGTLQ